MKKKYFFLILFLLQVFIVSYGQNGYDPGFIITNDNDTIKGLIKLKSNYLNSRSCNFIDGNKQNARDYSPSDINAYRIENKKYYVSKEVSIDSVKQRIFLEYLVEGIVNLYYFKDLQKEYFFLEKESNMISLSNEASMVIVKEKGVTGEEIETQYSKNSNQYRRMLTYLFQDSPGTLQKISSTGFDYRSLIKITLDYHRAICKDDKCIDFTRSTKKSLFIEPYFGMIDSWMGLYSSKNHVYQSNLYAGIQFRFKPAKRFTHLNFLAGINVSSNNFQGDFVNTLYTTDYIKTYRIHTQYSILRIPLTFEYTFGLKKLQPFISLSYNNVFLLNPQYEIIRIMSYYDDPQTSHFRKYEFGISPGLGLRINMDPKTFIFVKSEFEYRKSLVNFNDILDYHRVSSWLISAGIGFKIK
jgi:hypothetical protein